MENNDLFYNDLYNKYNNLNHKQHKQLDSCDIMKQPRVNCLSSKKIGEFKSTRKQLIICEDVQDNDLNIIRPKIRKGTNPNQEGESNDKGIQKDDPFSKLLAVNKPASSKNKPSTNNLINPSNFEGKPHNTTGFKATKQTQKNNKTTNLHKEEVKQINEEQKVSRKNLLLTKELGLPVTNTNKTDDLVKISRRRNSIIRKSEKSIPSIHDNKVNLEEKKKESNTSLNKHENKNKTIAEDDENNEKDVASFVAIKEAKENSILIEEDALATSKKNRNVNLIDMVEPIEIKHSEECISNGILDVLDDKSKSLDIFNESSFDSEHDITKLKKLTQSEKNKLVEQSSEKIIESSQKEHTEPKLIVNMASFKKPITNTNATRAHKLVILDDEKEIEQTATKQQRGSFLKEVTTANKYCDVDTEKEIVSIKSNTQYYINFNNSIGSIPGNIKLSMLDVQKKRRLDSEICIISKAEGNLAQPFVKSKSVKKKRLLGCLPLCY